MKNILLGISGGIAAYKSILLARALKQQGYAVQCILTDSAAQFVNELTLKAVSGLPVHKALFDTEAQAGMGHIELARWADTLLIAPATANTIAKITHGIADNLLTTLYLATEAEVIIVPAMNHKMWLHSATQKNLKQLLERDKHCVLPVGTGAQACGENGPGRMLEPEEIIQFIDSRKDFSQLNLLITAGPTRESIDPVRYISNYSSGKMGYALAEEAVRRGAKVTLVSGQTALARPAGCEFISVVSAQDMYEAVMIRAKKNDIMIGAAAVADYCIANPAVEKQKKSVHGKPVLELIETPDIIAAVSAMQENRPFTIGFAAETENLLEYARAKRSKKQLNLIIANNVRENPFGSDNNQVTLISAESEILLDNAPKTLLAHTILTHILQLYQKEIK